MQIEDSVFWIVITFMLLLMAVFPPLVTLAAKLMGISSNMNFLFVFIIFILILKLFSLSVHISQLDNKIKELAQNLALEKHRNKELSYIQKTNSAESKNEN